MALLYLGHSYRAAVELGDALVGLITSLPHPIILQESDTLYKTCYVTCFILIIKHVVDKNDKTLLFSF